MRIIKSLKHLITFSQVVITMRVIIKDIKLVITEPKTIHFNLPKDANSNFKHEIEFIIKYTEFLAEQTIKNRNSWLLSKYKHGNNINEHGKQ